MAEIYSELKFFEEKIEHLYGGYSCIGAIPNELLFRQTPVVGPITHSPTVLETLKTHIWPEPEVIKVAMMNQPLSSL